MERHRVIAAVLVVGGICWLVLPGALYVFHSPHYSVTMPYQPVADAPDDATVAFDALSSREREALYFTGRPTPSYIIPTGGPPQRRSVLSAAEWDRADAIRGHSYVSRDGERYRIQVDRFRTTRRWRWSPVAAAVAAPWGGLILALGLLVRRTGSLMPLTPRRAFALPAGAGLASLTLFPTMGISFSVSVDGTLQILSGALLVTSFAVLGTALAARKWRWTGGFVFAWLAATHVNWTLLGGESWWAHVTPFATVGVPFLLLGIALSPGGRDGVRALRRRLDDRLAAGR